MLKVRSHTRSKPHLRMPSPVRAALKAKTPIVGASPTIGPPIELVPLPCLRDASRSFNQASTGLSAYHPTFAKQCKIHSSPHVPSSHDAPLILSSKINEAAFLSLGSVTLLNAPAPPLPAPQHPNRHHRLICPHHLCVSSQRVCMYTCKRAAGQCTALAPPLRSKIPFKSHGKHAYIHTYTGCAA